MNKIVKSKIKQKKYIKWLNKYNRKMLQTFVNFKQNMMQKVLKSLKKIKNSLC